MTNNSKRATLTIMAIIAFICSTIFFIYYGPILAIKYQEILNKNGIEAANYTIGFHWIFTIISAGWLLIIAAVLDIIVLCKIKKMRPQTAYQTKWLFGSSLAGILICPMLILILEITGNKFDDTFLTIQSVILSSVIIAPILAILLKKLHSPQSPVK